VDELTHDEPVLLLVPILGENTCGVEPVLLQAMEAGAGSPGSRGGGLLGIAGGGGLALTIAGAFGGAFGGSGTPANAGGLGAGGNSIASGGAAVGAFESGGAFTESGGAGAFTEEVLVAGGTTCSGMRCSNLSMKASMRASRVFTLITRSEMRLQTLLRESLCRIECLLFVHTSGRISKIISSKHRSSRCIVKSRLVDMRKKEGTKRARNEESEGK
jgi:hypothetical protein